MTDTLSPILDKAYDTLISMHREGLIEFGGATVEVWRFFAPERMRRAKVGETWDEVRVADLHNDRVRIDQRMEFMISYQYRGEVDTLGSRALVLDWKINGKTLHGYVLKTKDSLDHFIQGEIQGTSYFSKRDGILLMSRSTETVNFQTLYGIIDYSFTSNSVISRGAALSQVAIEAPNVHHDTLPQTVVRVKVGDKAPKFSFHALDNQRQMITNDMFAGKYYLIDFWATWCGPCVQSIQSLDSIYAAYRASNFDILSASLDMAPDFVENYRKKSGNAMPWTHVILPDKLNDPFFLSFGAPGIPYSALIGPDGTILAVASGADELTGVEFQQTLARYLHKQDNVNH